MEAEPTIIDSYRLFQHILENYLGGLFGDYLAAGGRITVGVRLWVRRTTATPLSDRRCYNHSGLGAIYCLSSSARSSWVADRVVDGTQRRLPCVGTSSPSHRSKLLLNPPQIWCHKLTWGIQAETLYIYTNLRTGRREWTSVLSLFVINGTLVDWVQVFAEQDSIAYLPLCISKYDDLK